MPKFVFSAPVDLTPDDEVSFETEIRVGSVVTIERKGDQSVSIKALSMDEQKKYDGNMFRVAKGDRPGEICFSLWKSC
jgi:hypothetical protein